MSMHRGRFHPSAQGTKLGIVTLVPRPIIDQEQEQVMQMICDARVQQLIIHLRRGGIKHLDVNELMKRGEYKGYAPIHVAVMRGTSSIVAALLELAKADPDVHAANTRETALHLAAAKGDVGMTRALLTHGAKADAMESHRLTPLLIAAAAALKGSFHHLVSSELLKAHASLNARDPQGDTPIHLACDTLLALPLINEYCTQRGTGNLQEALEAINSSGEGVLHRAISRKQPEVAQLLLKAKARPDVRSADGDTPMHCAARGGYETIARLLLESESAVSGERDVALNASNLAGETPLHLAMSGASVAHARVAKMLLDRGAFAYGRTRNGESVLHACAREGNVELAKMILSRPTDKTVQALNARSLTGGSPLHMAVAHRQGPMVALLLTQDSLDRGAVDGEGNSAINIACQREELPLLQQLLSAGRGVRSDQLMPRNCMGWAPLHTSAFQGHDAAVRLLLQWQAPVDQPTADGWTALLLASAQGHASVTRSLLAGGASIDMPHHRTGESALGLAAARSHHAVIRELLSAGAPPAAPSDAYGWTPMHDALRSGDEASALALLARGGRLRAKMGARAKSRRRSSAHPPLDAGDALNAAPGALRRRVVEEDERRRREARLEGRESDSDEGVDDDDDEWRVDDADAADFPPATQILLPHPQAQPLERHAGPRPDRSGRFGAF